MCNVRVVIDGFSERKLHVIGDGVLPRVLLLGFFTTHSPLFLVIFADAHPRLLAERSDSLSPFVGGLLLLRRCPRDRVERGELRPGVQPRLLGDVGRQALLVPEVRVFLACFALWAVESETLSDPTVMPLASS